MFGSKKRIASLQNELESKQRIINELNAKLSPELQQNSPLQEAIKSAQSALEELKSKTTAETAKLSELQQQIHNKEAEIIQLDDEILLQSYGVYTPKYNFINVAEYAEKLTQIRGLQKDLIRADSAVTGKTNWTVNNSATQGRKMVKDMQKLLLRAFNSECDEIINKVKHSNYEASVKRINSSSEAISKLGTIMGIHISKQYLSLKLQELTLAFEYQLAKQEEKERIRELKEQEREQRALEKEIEAERKRLQKEQNHYENALGKVLKQLENNPQDPDLLQKKAEIESHIADAEKAMQEVDYREANHRAGYVYVISNIGAFGEGVYKIGMTRRLDPQERIDELGDASVPFRFDVHAMIFSDDAPALENALHKAFEDRRLNKVNLRREFFKVSLDEIKAVVKANYSKTAEFIEIPEAEQYRTSLKM